MLRNWILAVAIGCLFGATASAQNDVILGEPYPSADVLAPRSSFGISPRLGVAQAPLAAPAPVNVVPSNVGPVLGGPVVGGPMIAEPWLAQPQPMSPAFTLYPNVKYIQCRNQHPCPVPMIVSVKDPCSLCDKCNPCPTCVNVQICAPPCDCPCKINCNRDGSKVCYSWGKYSVTITSKKNGQVVVDYND